MYPLTDPADNPSLVLIGDHLAMDFLNSIENPSDPASDNLCDGIGLVCWMEAAGAIGATRAEAFRRTDRTLLDAIAGEARAMREWFRSLYRSDKGIVIDVPSIQLAPLNAVLAHENSYGCVLSNVEAGHQHLALERVNRWQDPQELLQPLALAIARLLTEEDLKLVRNCEGPTCTLMFIDRTKSRRRRWCSMAVCGNRAKAAAFRAKGSPRAD